MTNYGTTTPMLNTLAIVKKMTAAGMPVQPGGSCRRDAGRHRLKTNLASKRDVDDARKDLKKDIDDLRKDVKKDIDDLRKDVKKDIDDLRKDVEERCRWTSAAT